MVSMVTSSVGAGLLSMAVSMMAGHPAFVSFLCYMLGGVCMMLALALRVTAQAPMKVDA